MVKKAGCGGDFDGLCCRMVIETKRVFDGCALTDRNITLTLTTDAVLPQQATFACARVTGSELVGYSVTDGTGGCCRVTGDVVTTFAVTYESGGSCFTVPAVVRETRSVLLKLPESGIVPFSIEVQSTMSVNSGAIIGSNAVSVSGCLLQIIKVTAPVDILIPTYGYCHYPPCTGCVCDADFGTNVFPAFGGDEV